MNICSNCGKEISEDAVHCGHCGHRQEVAQKKTMMGLGAVDPDWQKKLQESKEGSSEDASGSQESVDDLAMEATAAMESVTVSDKSDRAAPSPEPVSEAATEMLGALADEDDEDLVSADTAAMDSVSSTQQSDPQPEVARTEPIPAAGAGFSDAGLGSSSSDASEEGRDDWQIGKLDSQVEQDLDPGQRAELRSEPAGGDPFPEPAGGDPFPEPVQQDLAMEVSEQSSESGEAVAGEGGGNTKRIFLVLGVVGVLFFSCCIFGAVGFHFFGADLIDSVFEESADHPPIEIPEQD